jgi:accessory gene regulator protein AgrB
LRSVPSLAWYKGRMRNEEDIGLVHSLSFVFFNLHSFGDLPRKSIAFLLCYVVFITGTSYLRVLVTNRLATLLGNDVRHTIVVGASH